MTWVYRPERDGDGDYLYVVGYYVIVIDPESTIKSNWVAIEDLSEEHKARKLVNYLNGGSTSDAP